ncbi:hypothetical protein ACOMHN_031268 [Nucella lapillus]
MAWRFKVSKYKNAAPKFPKKEELIQDIPVGSAGHSCGNHIKASCVYMAFNTDSSGGGTLGYLPLNAKGRIGDKLPVIHAHGDFVTDFDFSPFDDYMLATGSQDNSVKVWVLPEEGCGDSVSNPRAVLPPHGCRVEGVLWHPTAEGVLALSSGTAVRLVDVAAAAEHAAFTGHGDQVQSMSWRAGGSVMATTCRDKQMRVLDLRTGTLAQTVAGHQNVKDTRVVWLGDTDFILSTGFSMGQEREIKLWDNRNLTAPLTTQSARGSTGALMCFFDPDTNMVFLSGKSDNSVRFAELTEKSPYLTEGLTDRTDQVKGAALVPKRAMDLMSGEVDRLLLLVNHSVIPLPYIVPRKVDRLLLLVNHCVVPLPYIMPRKSYRDFHSDLYPDTASGEPALTAQQWFSGQDAPAPTVSLAPNKTALHHHKRGSLFGKSGGGGEGASEEGGVPLADDASEKQPPSNKPSPAVVKEKPTVTQPKPSAVSPAPGVAEDPAPSQDGHPVHAAPDSRSTQPAPGPAKPTKVFKVSVSLNVYVPQCLCPSVSMSLSVCVPQCLCPSVSMSLSVYVPQCLCPRVSVSLSVYVPQCLCPSMSMSLSAYVPQCLCPSVSVSLSVCPSVSVPQCLYPPVSMSLNVCVPQCLCPSVSVSLNVCVPQCLCPSMSVSVSVCPPVSMSLSVYVPQCLCPSVSVSLNVCVPQCLCPPVSMFLSVYVPQCLCPPVSVSLSVYVPQCLCPPVSVSLNVCVPQCLCPPVSMSLSVYVPQCLCPPVSMSLSVCPSVSVSPSVYVPQCLCPPVSVSLNVCVPQCLCPPVSMSLSVYVPQCLCPPVSMSLSVCPSVSVSPSVYVPQCLCPSVSVPQCLCPSVSMSLSVCPPVSMSLSVCPPVSVSLSVYVPQCLSPSVYVPQCLSPSVYVPQCLSPSVCVPQCLCPPVSMSPSVYVPQCLSLSVCVPQCLCPPVSMSLSVCPPVSMSPSVYVPQCLSPSVYVRVRQSKYRYISGRTLHPSSHLTNVRNISKSIPHDSDLFVANTQRCAVPLEGTGGIIAILELDKPGRLGDTAEELPTIQNGSKVTDLAWDPSDTTRLIVGQYFDPSDTARLIVGQYFDPSDTARLIVGQYFDPSDTARLIVGQYFDPSDTARLIVGQYFNPSDTARLIVGQYFDPSDTARLIVGQYFDPSDTARLIVVFCLGPLRHRQAHCGSVGTLLFDFLYYTRLIVGQYFAWDPSDTARLIVACDSAKINVWRVPPEGFPVGPSQVDPEFYLVGHMEKIYFVRFHPLVKDIVMSASYDMTVRMWNLVTRSEVMQLQGHQDQVFSLAWSPSGSQCATICKDGQLRIFEPRTSTEPIKVGKGPIGSRGARVVWVLDGRYLVVSGFQSSSEGQQLSVHSVDKLETLVLEEFHKSPSILIPFYDNDASTLFLFCRGERTVHNYDVSEEPPHLFGNATVNLQSLQQGLSFLPRCELDVREVEVAKAWRLTNSSVEPVSFSLPRVRKELFQDDLYPDTPVTWEATLTADQWLRGQDAKPRYISLRPPGMKLLSEAPAEAPKAKKYESFSADSFKSDEQKKDELMTAMVGKLELSTDPLPQDLAEGVDDDEWDD